MGRPYMWCQTICGLLYENKTAKNRVNTPQDEKLDLDSDSPKSSDEKIDEQEESNETNENESESIAGEANLGVKNEAKFLEQIISRLKSRFKARYILQDTINSLSNFFFLFSTFKSIIF